MLMDKQSWRKRGVRIVVLLGLLAILFLAYKLAEQQIELLQTNTEAEINRVQATVTAQANLLTTAEVEAQVVLETAVAAQSLQATSEAQVNEMAATATAQLPTPLPAPAEPQPLEPDQETLAYQLALEAELILKEQPALLERSVLLAIEAVQRHPNAGAVEILKNGISLLPSHEKTLNHQDFGYNLAYSPDGQYVASSGNDNNSVLIWDINNNREAARLLFEDRVNTLVFSPEGHYLAIAWGDIFGADNTVTLWETTAGEEVFSFPFENTPIALQFSPDTHYLAVATEELVTLRDLTTGLEMMSVPNNGTDVTFSSDGQFLYTIHDGVQQWNIATGKQGATMVGEDNIKGKTVFSPQSNYLLQDGFGLPKIWSLETGVAVELESGTSYLFSETVFSPDEKYLITVQVEGSLAGDTFGQNLVQLWDVTTGRELMRIEAFAFDVTFSPDGRYLVVPMGRVAHVWELPSQQEAFRIVQDEPISSPVFSPDGRTVIAHNSNWVTENRSTDVWEMIPAQWYWRFEHGSPSGIHSMAFSPDGRYVATGGEENFIYVWDTLDF